MGYYLCMLNGFDIWFQNFIHSVSGEVLALVVFFSPIWLPILLLVIFWRLWCRYVRAGYLYSRKNILLEIKVPKEVSKSPLAMEIIINTLFQWGDGAGWYELYWRGKRRPWFSLEIISIEGNVRFFIWGRSKYKKLIEAQVYAQFPEAEVTQVEDYTKLINYNHKKFEIWGIDYQLIKPDPYPIKTYVDYGMLDDPKEEFRIDPLSQVVEFLGSIGKGEQVWLQIMIRSHFKDRRKKWKNKWKDIKTKFKFFELEDGWKEDAKAEIEKIRERATPKGKDFPNPTKGDIEIIAALEKSVSKLGFETGIRSVYLAEKDKYNDNHEDSLAGLFKPFGAEHLNGLKPFDGNWSFGFGGFWGEFRGEGKIKNGYQLYEAYRRRSYFHPPFKTKYFILNTEELATLFHFPGSNTKTPTFQRITSKKVEAPANLPI